MNAFFIYGKPSFINVPRSLQKDPPDCMILEICVFDHFILADELFVRPLQGNETCLFIRITNQIWP